MISQILNLDNITVVFMVLIKKTVLQQLLSDLLQLQEN